MANRTKQVYQMDVRAGMETRYGMDGPRIESHWGARFPAAVQTQPPVQWYRVFPRGKAAFTWIWPLTPIKRRG